MSGLSTLLLWVLAAPLVFVVQCAREWHRKRQERKFQQQQFQQWEYEAEEFAQQMVEILYPTEHKE